MLDAPRNGYGEHTSEAPKTYARRPAPVFHGSSRISVLSFKAGGILHPRAPREQIEGRPPAVRMNCGKMSERKSGQDSVNTRTL
jgi:hypothetical protein